MRETKKQKMINELLEGTNLPNWVRTKIERRTTDVIEFYFYDYKVKGMSKKDVIWNIIRIG